MNSKKVENLRKELDYIFLDSTHTDDWDYIKKLEQEVIRLREQLGEVQKGYAQSIEAREGGIKWPTP
mgnify:FL=1